MRHTCTHCGVEKDYKLFRAHYKNGVVRTLSVCHDCQAFVEPPLMGWGTRTPRRKPRAVVIPEQVKQRANDKRRVAMLKKHRRYPIKQLEDLLDRLRGFRSLNTHPYGVVLREVVTGALQRLRANPVSTNKGEWYDFLTEQEVLTLKEAAVTLVGLRTKADLDKYIPVGI